MNANIELISPAFARLMLESNATWQRNLRSTTVSKYAKDMKDGRWVATHQGIAFSVDGVLIDGQHRLRAIIEAGVSVEMLVMRNVPANAFDHVDIGANRDTVDVMRAAGDMWLTKNHVSMARIVEWGVTSQAGRIASPFALKEAVVRNRTAIEFALTRFAQATKTLSSAPVLAAFSSAWYEEDHDRLAYGIEVLKTGLSDNVATDATMIRLRDWLMSINRVGGAVVRAEINLKTQRAVKSFCKGESLKKLFTPDSAIYPPRALTLK